MQWLAFTGIGTCAPKTRTQNQAAGSNDMKLFDGLITVAFSCRPSSVVVDAAVTVVKVFLNSSDILTRCQNNFGCQNYQFFVILALDKYFRPYALFTCFRGARKPMEFKRGESRASEKQNPAVSRRGERG